MKKNNTDKSPENSETIKQEPLTSTDKTEQGEANPSFPQEYEEQRSMDIRMKPQPLAKPEKSGE